MQFNRVLAIVLRQYYLYSGKFSRFLTLFMWVALDMIVWGFITKYLDKITTLGFNFATTILGAVILWNFFMRVMHGVTVAFLEDVWSRNFLNYFASPLTTTEYILGLVITSIITSLIGLLVMLILSTSIFGLSFFIYGIMLMPFIFILFLFGIALGIVGCSIVMRYGPSSEWLIWPLPAMLAPCVGVFYPVSTLPVWMQYVSYFLPPSYVFENIRLFIATGSVSWISLLWSATLAISYIGLAFWLFSFTYKSAVKTGLIARYTAEGVG